MRLKSVFISNYKNLKDFSITFDTDNFLEIFLGKNGSGKSNFFEALIEIFQHITEFGTNKNQINFEYKIDYLIGDKITTIEWKSDVFLVNEKPARRTPSKDQLPENIILYYSGQNPKIKELIATYENNFASRIKGAELKESRRFIGIDHSYKNILIFLLLLREEDNHAKKLLKEKFSIDQYGDEIGLILERPSYAKKGGKRSQTFDIDSADSNTSFWGVKGIVRDFLDGLLECVKGGFSPTEIYNSDRDEYSLMLNIALLRQKPLLLDDWFRQLDNLKLLGMLKYIKLPLVFNNGMTEGYATFSDGQFQSLYIYALTEIFKARDCLMLLDEPDAFLHPEWQATYLTQIEEISAQATRSNHILLSSHSAVTLIPYKSKKVRFFDLKDGTANLYSLPKTVAIQKLSNSIIKYSEQEQLLSILNAIQIENKPVFFTEGSTDPVIIRTAWLKLYEEEPPFIPFYAFSCTFIKNLITDQRIHAEMGDRPIFAMFDFDKAYDQWNGIKGVVVEQNPFKGLTKAYETGNAYVIMLPIPPHQHVQKQVLKNAQKMTTFEGESLCEIEHFFYGLEITKDYFDIEPCAGGGERIIFKSDSDKTHFAREVVPCLPAEYFEPFRPMFDFIKSKTTKH